MTKRQAVAEPEAVNQIAEVVKHVSSIPAPAPRPDETGFYSDANWITINCDWPSLTPRDGFSSISAEIDASLTFTEAFSIPIEAGTPLKEVFPHIVHRVRAWNLQEWNVAAGELTPVPPPAEIGIDAFLRCRPLVVEWLAWAIRTYSLSGGPNRKNGMTPSDDGSSGANAGA